MVFFLASDSIADGIWELIRIPADVFPKLFTYQIDWHTAKFEIPTPELKADLPNLGRYLVRLMQDLRLR